MLAGKLFQSFGAADWKALSPKCYQSPNFSSLQCGNYRLYLVFELTIIIIIIINITIIIITTIIIKIIITFIYTAQVTYKYVHMHTVEILENRWDMAEFRRVCDKSCSRVVNWQFGFWEGRIKDYSSQFYIVTNACIRVSVALFIDRWRRLLACCWWRWLRRWINK